MTKILEKLIKDSISNKSLKNYELDFRNNIINYKNCALFKAELNMLNSSYYAISTDVKICTYDKLKLIFNKASNNKLYNLKLLNTKDKKKTMLACEEFTTNIANEYLKLIDLDSITDIKASSYKSAVLFYKGNEIIALVCPIV